MLTWLTHDPSYEIKTTLQKKKQKKSQDSRFNNLISNNESKEKSISPK